MGAMALPGMLRRAHGALLHEPWGGVGPDARTAGRRARRPGLRWPVVFVGARLGAMALLRERCDAGG